ncbi:hypothetical protein T10_11917 [Trichinella papuae]|uniref:Uncharacterized protein n=1 Tax=Trichinella papuae TaxID=268474 RepID=A0A0V1MS52_9BILA|nr:hypothetical protein T10_11917 [Trichinella papuae]
MQMLISIEMCVLYITTTTTTTLKIEFSICDAISHLQQTIFNVSGVKVQQDVLDNLKKPLFVLCGRALARECADDDRHPSAHGDNG